MAQVPTPCHGCTERRCPRSKQARVSPSQPAATPVQVAVPAPKLPAPQSGQIWLESVLQVSVTAQLAPGMVLQAHGEASTR